jgi:ABC-type glycerol-3-phosphate transport system substrate-binding protein
MKKKQLSILILSFVLLASLIAGCSNGGTTGPATPSVTATGETASATPAPSMDPAPSRAPIELSNVTWTPLDLPTQGETVALPLCEKTTISAWTVWSSTVLKNINESIAAQELERITNVHVEYSTASATEADTAFSLLASSGDYPDIIMLQIIMQQGIYPRNMNH